jgi:hypothetical protein
VVRGGLAALEIGRDTKTVLTSAALAAAAPAPAPVAESLVKSYSLSHLADQTLLRDLAALVARDRATTAALLAHLAEVDARRLYLPAGFPSMFAYCVNELHLSDDAAFKRIRAARAARQFPALFIALAEGRLNLSAVVMLTPYLAAETVDELLTATAYRSKAEIERFLAQRFPRPDVPTQMRPLAPALPTDLLATRPVGTSTDERVPGPVGTSTDELAPGPVGTRVDPLALRPVEASPQRYVPACLGTPSKVTPLSSQRFALQVTIGRSTHDKLRYAQELLSHRSPSGEVAEVLDRALDVLIRELEKAKFAATKRPRRSRRPGTRPRHVPAEVKRAVWERDGGRCTFVSDAGRRCPSRKFLEFDHIDEVARGGRASVAGIRLRCRAHNQFSAERTFGVDFMRHKREQAQRRAEATRAAAAAKARAEEVIPWLRALGFRADEARRAAERCEAHVNATLEQRVRIALAYLGRETIRAARVRRWTQGKGPEGAAGPRRAQAGTTCLNFAATSCTPR